MDNKQIKNDVLKVDEVLGKKEPVKPADKAAYPADWTLNTVKSSWGNKYSSTIIITGKR